MWKQWKLKKFCKNKKKKLKTRRKLREEKGSNFAVGGKKKKLQVLA